MGLPGRIASPRDTLPDGLEALAKSPDAAARRSVARNPHTPERALEQLGHDSDKSVREAVAGNPNAPADTLMRLGAQFPDQLLGNPALDAMVLENPHLFSMVPEETLAAIAKRETCPPEVLGHLARAGHGKGLLMSLIQNGRTPVDAIRYIAHTPPSALAERFETPEDNVRAAQSVVRHHFAIRGEVTADEARIALWRAVTERALSAEGTILADLLPWTVLPQRQRDELAAWTLLLHGALTACRTVELPGSLLEAIACGADKKSLKAVQSCAQCPPWLESVATAEEAIRAIQTNRSASEALLQEAVASNSEVMRLALAGHPLAQGKVDAPMLLHSLAESRIEAGGLSDDSPVERKILRFVASSAQTAPETLKFLYESVQVKDRPPLPPELAKHAGRELQVALEKWLRAPGRTADQLLSASRFFFSTDILVIAHPNAPAHLASSWVATAELLFELGKNPRTPASIISRLAEWGEDGVASNVAADAHALRTIYAMSPLTAGEIARNPSAPPDLLLAVTNSRNQEDVLPALVSNPSSPEEVLLRVATCKAWRDLLEFSDADRKLLNHPNTTGPVLDALIVKGRIDLDAYGVRLARDQRLCEASFQRLAKIRGGAAVRKQLAANSAVSNELLAQLAEDKDDSVRKAASRALQQRRKGEGNEPRKQ